MRIHGPGLDRGWNVEWACRLRRHHALLAAPRPLATIATIATPAVQEKLKELGYVLVVPERRSTEYLGKFVASEVEKWSAVIKAANIKPE